MMEPPPFPVVASANGWFAAAVLVVELYSATTVCWFCIPVPSEPTPMKKERFSQITVLYSLGNDAFLQSLTPGALEWPAGQFTLTGVRFSIRFALLGVDATPAIWEHDFEGSVP